MLTGKLKVTKLAMKTMEIKTLRCRIKVGVYDAPPSPPSL